MAIRSFSHRVLAQIARMLSCPTFEPKEARGLLRLWLLPARFFLVKRSINRMRSLAQAYSGAPAQRPSRHRRDQKTFSTGPRSFRKEVLWFSAKSRQTIFRVQRVFDSRHSRITDKGFANCVLKFVESSRLQSDRRGSMSTERFGSRLLKMDHSFFIVLSGNIRFSS